MCNHRDGAEEEVALPKISRKSRKAQTLRDI